MGFLSSIFKARDKPTDRAVSSNYTFLMGSTTAGKTVTERSALQMTAVYSCIRILAEAVAGLPLHLYRYTDDGGKEKAIDHPLYRLLHDEPNSEMSSFVFRETLMTHLLLWGNCYAQIIHNGKGEVVGLYPLMPNRMSVHRDESGQLYYLYTRGADDVNNTKDMIVKLSTSDVLHIPGLGFDGLVGYSPIAMAKNAIGLAIATEEYGAKFFANGAAPSGVLEHPGTIKEPGKVREAWQSQFGGSANSNKIAVLEEGMKYTPISISPEQAQFLETRKFQINEIARIFRVPPHMVGDLEKSSFSNIEQQSLEFVKYTLDPWVVRWEQTLARILFTPEEKKKYFFRFNVEGLLRGDYESRMSGYATARQNGWMSANDIRELENLDRIPSEDGGDMYLVNGNMLPLTKAGAFADTNEDGKEENPDEEQKVLAVEESSKRTRRTSS
ncbi:HK97 family phage portal protein [Listeria monocytogenes]|uniref:phage portal protein n=1 Tax=Listeria monocytogenes TaxID=1639 RepID=UPI00074D667B|nr:phage portal protein [Listeria monocytogenes]EAE7887189.1 phage portal protein [Listeria monocytogenes]CUL88494.1 HK97 family phage portal protein [Listeria monocytogenes]